ncbi:MAG TPA: alpha/beta hydrolase, partial [Gemmatimonadaceae bacterium]|nr:alpha/beta hydrolase [Gemmatimonadaceae bacterium]
LEEMWRGFASLSDAEARSAFIQTLRGIVDIGGQRVSAADRLYLAQEMPTLFMWGERDPIIPFEHGLAAHELVPHSEIVSFPDAGHFPHRNDPRRFVRELTGFIESTEPSHFDEELIRDLLREGGRAKPRRRTAQARSGRSG